MIWGWGRGIGSGGENFLKFPLAGDEKIWYDC